MYPSSLTHSPTFLPTLHSLSAIHTESPLQLPILHSLLNWTLVSWSLPLQIYLQNDKEATVKATFFRSPKRKRKGQIIDTPLSQGTGILTTYITHFLGGNDDDSDIDDNHKPLPINNTTVLIIMNSANILQLTLHMHHLFDSPLHCEMSLVRENLFRCTDCDYKCSRKRMIDIR